GKPDAGTDVDLGNQMLLAHLPMLSKPGAKDVFVLGMGSGITAGSLRPYPLEHIVVAENCKPVVQAAQLFADWNYHVLDDPRVKVWVEDARTVLKLRPETYDTIITEPSNPWSVGVGSVFSKEFYELAATRLKPDGIIAQWFHVYEVNDEIVDLVLRTFSSVFPFVEIWDTGIGDIVILGSKHPWATGPDVFRSGFNIPRVKTDMWMIDVHSPEALMARQLASQKTGFAIAGKGPIQSDLFPILEYAAPRAFYIGSRSSMLDRYDERTYQQLFAPANKRSVLASLPLSQGQMVFSTFSTINGQFYGCLFGTSLGSGIPCAMATPSPAPSPASDETALSYAARAFNAGQLDQAAQLINLVLQQYPKNEQAAYASRIIEREKRQRMAQPLVSSQ
ncbi:MAG TPA: fused MFS/spermidine synthase, partial [Verrucomicrobiae bacterium]